MFTPKGAAVAQKLGVYAKWVFESLYYIAMLVIRYILNKLSVEAAEKVIFFKKTGPHVV